MKNLILSFFVLFLFSCEKEPCQFGTIQIENTGGSPAMIYSIEGRPTVYPGESINQRVDICNGFDENGNECSGAIQTVVTYKFLYDEMKDKGVIVHRCKTTEIQIFN